VCQKPRGAFYTVAKLPVEDAERFCIFLLDSFQLEGETVMVAPAAGFYATPGAGRDEVRIAYVLNTHDLERALHVFDRGLAAFRSTQ
jgi:aspartate aminotransferase